MALPLYDHEPQGSPEHADAASPSFTTAMRGYHKDEVDAYLRDLHTEQTRERQHLEREAHDLRQRVTALERCVTSDTPHTIDALGERLLLILHHAEAGATEALHTANAQAQRIRREAEERAETHVRQASLRASQATQGLAAAKAKAQRIRDEAQAALSTQRQAVLATAEATALALVADAERHAEAVRSRAAEEDAQARDHMARRRAVADAQLDELADQRDDLLAEMAEIHDALARTLQASGFIEVASPETDPIGLIATADPTSGRSSELPVTGDDPSPTMEQPVVSEQAGVSDQPLSEQAGVAEESVLEQAGVAEESVSERPASEYRVVAEAPASEQPASEYSVMSAEQPVASVQPPEQAGLSEQPK